MDTKTKKAKGRRLQQWVARQIARVTGFECGKDKPICSREMGQSGVDIRMESQVWKVFPYSVECKNCEKWDVHGWIKQARENQMPGTDWIVIAKRNNRRPVLFMDAETWFDLVERGKDGS